MLTARFQQITFLCALLVVGVFAWNNKGYYHADEHYQLIEFAGIKLGSHEAKDLAWEYKEASRSAIQPTMVYGVQGVLNSFGIENPYTIAFLLRLLSGISALVCLSFLIEQTKNRFSEGFQPIYWLLSYFLWFIPVVFVRFSSENWAGMCLLLGVGFLVGELSPKRLVAAGLAFGFSFLFRFQMGVVFIGPLLWLLFIRKQQLKNVFLFGLAILVPILMGVLIDRWFYGRWVLSSWNYFNLQLLQDAVNGFGTSPWYDYFPLVLEGTWKPIGWIIMLFSFLTLFRQPKAIYLWIIVPFILVHASIPHKELRFLFPLVGLVPFLVLDSFNWISERVSSKKWLSYPFLFVGIIAFSLNGIALVYASQKPADNGKMEITETIFNRKKKPTILIHTTWASPYNPFQSLPTRFYQEKHIREYHIPQLCNLSDSLQKSLGDSTILMVTRSVELENSPCKDSLQKWGFIEIKRSIPAWIQRVENQCTPLNRDEVLILFERKKR